MYRYSKADSLIRVSHTCIYICTITYMCTYVLYEFAKTSLSEMIPKPDGETLGDTDCMCLATKIKHID